jgi:uncharacterized membrane protein
MLKHVWNWHLKDAKERSFGEVLADAVANGMGSWKFIIAQSVFITFWIVFQIIGIFGLQWDPYPFILLNLLFSTQAAYSAPIIMMAQNRSADRDRAKAEFDHEVLGDVHTMLKSLVPAEVDTSTD